ncbi:methyltransferase [Obba rivulosa]|uniref:tRNA N(3)-methylcytidine methyltransferase n=1 Tax=Obba rivulosa TaxID=1052685 RepID=A0A8E2DVH2_9APHY|nr:methyltransferase [Obba rivulosa]
MPDNQQHLPESSAQKASRKASSVHDVTAEKPPFGARFLTDEKDVWSQNAWDHVPPPEGQEEIIAASLARQKAAPVPEEDKLKYNEKPAKHWDNFYKMNADNFFRNRKWLHLEFPELVKAAEPEAGPMTVAEIGCGAGNAVFPLLTANKNPALKLHAYDYSSHAVKLVQTNPLYSSPPIGTIQAGVWDVTSSSLPPDVQPGSVDIILLIFVLSALHPHEWRNAISNIHQMLKPGGLVLLRDYGRHDMAQLRFKGGRLLDDNFYVRGDKTRVYFFELDELALLFSGAPAPQASKTETKTEVVEEYDDAPDSEGASPNHTPAPSRASPSPAPQAADNVATASSPTSLNAFVSRPHSPTFPFARIHPVLQQPSGDASLGAGGDVRHPLFSVERLGIDRRLIVNRKRQIKMYRVWMQGMFRKLIR